MNISIFGGRSDMARTAPEDGAQSIAVFGSAVSDLSQVRLPESLQLSALAMFGSCKYFVPAGTEVVFRGFAMFGSQEYKALRDRPIGEYRSVIYLNSVALFGSVEVVEFAE